MSQSGTSSGGSGAPSSRGGTAIALAPGRDDPGPGRWLGRYQLLARLGGGGMGVVYEALDTLVKRHVAIKLLPESAEPASLKRFLLEARAAARLNHPIVIAIHDVAQRDGTHYLVMELIRGGSAPDYLRSRGPLDWPEATWVLICACRGLAAAARDRELSRGLGADGGR